ncbi:MAG TPA: hypothetical protein VGN88_04935, partial [Phycisphaerae bacterium]
MSHQVHPATGNRPVETAPRPPRRAVVSAAITFALTASGMLVTRAHAATTGIEDPVSLGTPQIISSDVDPATNYYTIIQQTIGAERWYDNGYFGGNTMMANVEAGYVWNGHETTMGINS